MRTTLLLAALGALLTLTRPAASAEAISLGLLPTPDLLPVRGLALEYEQEGTHFTHPNVDQDFSLRFGLRRDVEVAVLKDVSAEGETVGQVKVRLLPARRGRPALVAGALTLGSSGGAAPYLLAAGEVTRADLFIGLLRSQGTNALFWEVEYPLRPPLALVVTQVQVHGPSTGLGLSAEVTPALTVELLRVFGGVGEAGEASPDAGEAIGHGNGWNLDLLYTWGSEKQPPPQEEPGHEE